MTEEIVEPQTKNEGFASPEAENEAPIAQSDAETGQPVEESTGDADASSDDATDGEKTRRSRYQERLEELAAERTAAREAAEYWQDQFQHVTQKTSAPVEAPKPKPTGPQLADFETTEEWSAATRDWIASEVRKDLQTSQSTDAFDAKQSALAAEHDDYYRVTQSRKLPISHAMATTIRSLEQGPRVLYALGKDPSMSRRIASLPVELQAAELGKLEAQLSAAAVPKKPKSTRAPEPPQPISNAGGSANVDLSKCSVAEYMAQRRREVQAKRKR